MKIAVSGERLARALPSTLNSSINYFRPVSVKERVKVGPDTLWELYVTSSEKTAHFAQDFKIELLVLKGRVALRQ